VSQEKSELHLTDEQLDALSERIVDVLIDRVGLFFGNLERLYNEQQANSDS